MAQDVLFVPFEKFVSRKRSVLVTLSFQIFPSAAAAAAFESTSVVPPTPSPTILFSSGQIYCPNLRECTIASLQLSKHPLVFCWSY